MADVTMTAPASGREWRELREERKLTIAELAAITGLEARVISRLENGRPVSLPARKLVGVALGLGVDEVVNREAIA